MILKLRTLGIVLVLSCSLYSFGQTKKDQAFEKASEAISLMDNGKVPESIKLLEEAQKLDPDNINYPYELGYAYYILSDYKKSSKYLEGLLKHKDVNDKVYQLLGNCYDNLGKRDKAIETYEDGLKLFPNSGSLYLEMGVVQVALKDYNKAISYFEKGIQVAPQFPSNYYWAAKIYCGSTERVWGMIYGELFMNLERNSKRTEEISKLLFHTYKEGINFTSDTTMSVSFSKSITVSIEDLQNTDKMKLPFGVGIYEPTILFSALSIKSIDLESLNTLRSGFLEIYYSKEFDKSYPNAMFAYQKNVENAGHLEAYNHWILMMGDVDGFEKWQVSNEAKWNAFIQWFGKNGIVINDSNRFYREQY